MELKVPGTIPEKTLYKQLLPLTLLCGLDLSLPLVWDHIVNPSLDHWNLFKNVPLNYKVQLIVDLESTRVLFFFLNLNEQKVDSH